LIFRGTFEHSLDAKHRLTVPAKYRGVLTEGVVLAFTPDSEADTVRSLSLWTAADYEAFASATLNGLNPIEPRAQVLSNILYANAWDLELDSANRVMIPGIAREFAGLGKEVVVTGAGKCLRIWDRAAYTSDSAGLLARFPEIAASFEHTN
jgi:MraZ protein